MKFQYCLEWFDRYPKLSISNYIKFFAVYLIFYYFYL
jgi:hypothetical protein